MTLSPEFLQFITQYTNAVLNKINRIITRKITTTFQDSDEVIPSSKLVKDEFTTVRGEIPTKTSDLTHDSGFLTQHQDITGKEDKSNKVTSLSNNSTDDEYPSAKAVYTGLNGKANSSHTHDDRYYTETEINTKLSDYLTTDDASETYQPKGNYLTSHNPIDTALSSTSTNAVQNKVINTALGNKVDKVSGKGLSTNDFTASYKTALDNLNTTIANAVSNLEMIEVVTSLPTTDIKTNKLYLKANTVNSSENKYDFYVRVNDAWEKIDSLDFSISDYIKKVNNTNLLLADGSTKAQTNFATSDHNHDGTYLKTGTGTVTSTNIADKTIVNGDIADGTIESGKIKDGTIVNGDISSSAAIATSKISGLDTALSGKVAVSQGAGNSGKFLKVNSSGNVACESVTIPDISGKEDKSNKLTSLNGITPTNDHYPSIPLVLQMLTGLENTLEKTSNKVTSLSSSSTDTQYPSAKAVYDAIPSDTVTLTATLENGTTKTFTIYGNENTGD